MIQSILFFTLGFLCAGFLALMVAPAIWRRAVALTRKRIEASVPLSLTDIQADKDRMRAEFAMSTQAARNEHQGVQGQGGSSDHRDQPQPRRTEAPCRRAATDKTNRFPSWKPRRASCAASSASAKTSCSALAAKLAEAERAIEARALELDKMGRLYDEASLAASNRQIDLVVRETEVEKLAGDMQLLRGQRKDAERRLQDSRRREQGGARCAEGRAQEGHRARKEARADDRYAHRPRGKARPARARAGAAARATQGQFAGTEDELNRKLIDAQSDKIKLEAELADMTLQMSTLLSGAKGGDIEKAMAKLSEDRDRLEVRLTALTRENKKLRTDLAAHERSKVEDWSDERRGNALLREQINDLAAEVVSLTATLEGPDSPINKALAAAPRRRPGCRTAREDHQPRRPRAGAAEGRLGGMIRKGVANSE